MLAWNPTNQPIKRQTEWRKNKKRIRQHGKSEKKLTGYKQQDIYKKNLNIEKIINLKHIIDKLIETEIKCYYCKCEMYILYENVRDLKQWSVDRINNDLGHNVDNIVLACLDCNLKRRCKSSDKFLFTKQLNIIRQDN